MWVNADTTTSINTKKLRISLAIWKRQSTYTANLSEYERIVASSSVRAVATLRAFPGDGLEGYRRQALPERCEMSWTAALIDPVKPPAEEDAGAPVLIYERIDRQ